MAHNSSPDSASDDESIFHRDLFLNSGFLIPSSDCSGLFQFKVSTSCLILSTAFAISEIDVAIDAIFPYFECPWLLTLTLPLMWQIVTEGLLKGFWFRPPYHQLTTQIINILLNPCTTVFKANNMHINNCAWSLAVRQSFCHKLSIICRRYG